MKKIVLMGVPHHNNLGDNAIALAEERFIKTNFSNYDYCELEEENLEQKIDEVKDKINDDDVILFHGGGNLGDEYLYIEEARRKVINTFPNNLIILFPQTIYFKTQEELDKSKQIYSKHKKLTLIAREEESFKIMKKEFPHNNVIKTPDIVTYLNETKEEKRNGLLCLFRNDVEAKITREEKEVISKYAQKYFDRIEYDDTAKGNPIPIERRNQALENMFEKIRKSSLVITDRLHGMIFSAITSTPCISLNNYNHKVKSTFEYLKPLNYIKCIDDVEDLEENIKFLLSLKYETYKNDFAIKEFDKIKKIINRNK